MSRTMLHGLLRMPIECWRTDELDLLQRQSRYFEASGIIEAQDKTLASQQQEIDELKKQRKELQRLLAIYASNTGGGANDPDVMDALLYGISGKDTEAKRGK